MSGLAVRIYFRKTDACASGCCAYADHQWGECEPYLTCDDLTMRTYAAEIISGIKIMLKAVGASRALVGIEDNKRVAFSQMQAAASESPEVTVVSVPSIYPMGSEKHMIKALTGLEVPQGGSPPRLAYWSTILQRPELRLPCGPVSAAVGQPGSDGIRQRDCPSL
ncbi:hypothetical protein P4S72_16780 [Vibrio sp. PP-XX7]